MDYGPYGSRHQAVYGRRSAGVYGGFSRRVVAELVDAFVSSAVVWLVMLPYGRTPGSAGELVVGSLAWWLYAAGLESSSMQATVGKLALGMRVADEDEQRISFARASVRHFAKYLSMAILFVGFIMVAFTERKQGLHDLIARTVVLKGRA